MHTSYARHPGVYIRMFFLIWPLLSTHSRIIYTRIHIFLYFTYITPSLYRIVSIFGGKKCSNLMMIVLSQDMHTCCISCSRRCISSCVMYRYVSCIYLIQRSSALGFLFLHFAILSEILECCRFWYATCHIIYQTIYFCVCCHAGKRRP